MAALNSAQRRHLQERISGHFHSLRRDCYDDEDTPAVKRARALIEQHSEKRQQRGRARDDALRKAMRDAEAALNFKNPAEALAAVETFERFKLPR